MLTKPIVPSGRMKRRAAQSGVVLVIALIVLVAMTLAGLALARSVDTSNIIAGNLAFRQSTVRSGDVGSEAAIAWLQANNDGVTLNSTNTAVGYSALRADPAPNQTWDNYWAQVLSTQASPPFTDTSGNAVSYAIQRLCNAAGLPTAAGAGCAAPQAAGSCAASSKQQGAPCVAYNSQIFYRVTTRVVGPRNTVSYIQTIVAM